MLHASHTFYQAFCTIVTLCKAKASSREFSSTCGWM